MGIGKTWWGQCTTPARWAVRPRWEGCECLAEREAEHHPQPCTVGRSLTGEPALCMVNWALGVAVWTTGARGQNPWTSPLQQKLHCRARGLPGHKAPLCCGQLWRGEKCVLPAPFCPSPVLIAQLLLPPAPSSSPGFPRAFLFSRERGLIQCVLCNFPGLYLSHNTKSSKRMRNSHTKQCCTHGYPAGWLLWLNYVWTKPGALLGKGGSTFVQLHLYPTGRAFALHCLCWQHNLWVHCPLFADSPPSEPRKRNWEKIQEPPSSWGGIGYTSAGRQKCHLPENN